jgi:hypothetical protein
VAERQKQEKEDEAKRKRETAEQKGGNRRTAPVTGNR